MNPRLILAMLTSILLCASCQSQDDSSAANSMEASSRSHFGIDIEALAYIVSGPMTAQMDLTALPVYKQRYPIDQLIESDYISLCQPRAGRVMIQLTAKGEKLHFLFRKRNEPADQFVDSLGEFDCPPLKQ